MPGGRLPLQADLSALRVHDRLLGRDLRMSNQNDKPGRITFAEEETQGARIKVVGEGVGGVCTDSRMIASALQRPEFIPVNDDPQDLLAHRSPILIQISL